MKTFWQKSTHLLVVIVFLLSIVFYHEAVAQTQSNLLPAKPMQSEGTKEIYQIYNDTNKHLIQEHYDVLEQTAQGYRQSKEAITTVEPKLVVFYEALAVTLLSRERKAESIIEFMQGWLKARPESVTARIALATALVVAAYDERGSLAYSISEERLKIFNGRLNEIRSILRDAKKLPDKCPYWWVVTQEVGSAQSWDKSTFEAVYQEGLKFEPGWEPYYCQKAEYLHLNGDRMAGEWLQYANEVTDAIGGQDGDILYVRIFWHMARENYIASHILYPLLSVEKLDRGFRALLKRHPDDIMLLNMWARLSPFGNTIEVHDARKFFGQELFKKIGNRADSWIWPNTQNFESERDIAYQIPYFYALILDKIAKGELEVAIVELNQAIERYPQRAELYDARGTLKTRLQRYEAALIDYDRALTIDPEYSQTFINRSQAYAGMEQWEQALSDAERAVKSLPNFSPAYLNRGVVKNGYGDILGAYSDFQTALKIDPKSYDARYSAASVKSSQGDYQTAVQELDILIKMHPKVAKSYSTRAFAYYHQRQWQNSLSDFRKFLSLSKTGDDTIYQRYYIWLILNRQGKKDAATTELKAFLDTVPPSEGWKRKIGDFLVEGLSEEELLSAAEDSNSKKMKEKKAEAYYYAGMKHLLAGDRITAKSHLQKVLDYDLKSFIETVSARAQLKFMEQP